jgi:tetratricopeptide (TPR) repeat protein
MKTLFRRASLRLAAMGIAGLAVIGMMGCGSGSNGDNKPKSATSNFVAGAAGPTIDAETGKRAVVKESAIALFEQATKQAKTDPNGAIETFKRAAKEEDNFAEAYYNIGVIQQQLGNLKDAKESYQTAIQMRPGMAIAHNNLAEILIKEGNIADAETILLRIVDEKKGIDPYNAQANLNLGMIYRQRGEEILEKKRGGSEPKFSMEGSDKKEQIDDKEALAEFAKTVNYVRRALAADSNNIYCYENLAAVYYIMNALEVARLVTEQAMIKYNEYNESLKKDLDINKITQDEYEAKSYKPADLSAIYNTSGLIYLAEGDVSMGNSEFKKAYEADPTNVQAMLNLAGIAVNVQNYQEAYDLYVKVLEMEPDNIEAYLSKGVAARGLNNLDEAEKIYREIMDKHPDYPQAWFNLIVLYQEYYQKVDESREMWTKFIASPEANRIIPGRVAEAKERVNQIDELKRKTEEMNRKMEEMQRKMEEIERMSQGQ